jgi:hypothetical protein
MATTSMTIKVPITLAFPMIQFPSLMVVSLSSDDLVGLDIDGKPATGLDEYRAGGADAEGGRGMP